MEYKTVIGLEIHVQLKTKSKMFCGCDNQSYAKASGGKLTEDAAPNTLVCPVCLGLPGTLPVANKQAIDWTIKTGLALNSKIAKFSKFDRKHYFYPDLPKGYQISQYDAPFCIGGYLEVNINNEKRKINLTRIHLEEDAGKLLHTDDATLVDLNRAGTPLMEIVTEPDINSPAEAKKFMQELRAILRYLDVSDADMEKGHLRCDANISVSENRNGKWEMGVPAEIKNLNSFKMVERALIFEEKRQREVLENGEKVTKETRGWNDAKGETYSQRSKEFAQDYRYFPEPDLPPFEISDTEIENIKKEIPELPNEKRQRYILDIAISTQEAEILSNDKKMAEYFEKVASEVSPKIAAIWIVNELKRSDIDKIAAQDIIDLLKALDKNQISAKIAKDVLLEMTATGKNPKQIISEKGYKQVDNEDEIGIIIDKVIKENPKPIQDYKKGKKESLGFLIGQIMRETKGQINPTVVNEILIKKLERE